jgi:glycosyltransferase involved in cell wall biosynthesis
VPNLDVAERLARYFPDLALTVAPHDAVIRGDLPTRKVSSEAPLRVGTLGAISDIKGFSLLRDAAEHARKIGVNLEFVVIGYTKDDAAARAVGISVTGAYVDADLPETIAAESLDVIIIASRWPETYSYTLSAAIESGLPTVVFDIGAQAQRCREAGYAKTDILPLSTSSKELVLYFERMRQRRNTSESLIPERIPLRKRAVAP